MKKYKRALKSGIPVSDELLTAIYEEHDGPWLMWLMTSMYSISQKVNTQLQYVSLLSEWKGLSSKGREVISRVSSITTGNTYVRFKKRLQDMNVKLVDDIIDNGNFTWWIDNYAHSIFRNVPTIESTMFSHNLWTSVAMFTSEVVIDLRIGERIKHCLPMDIRKLLPGPGNLSAMVHDLHQQRTFEETLFFKYDISWIPIRPNKDYISKERLTRVIPVDVLKDNVGSQVGLVEVLKYVMARYKNRKGVKYTIGAVDTNIYWRLLKVHILHISRHDFKHL